MTVSSLVPVNIYAGNSSCKKFDFDFLIESDSELVVQHTDKNGITTILKNEIDYSIGEIGNKNGSYIIFPLEKSSYGVLKNDEKISLLLDLVIKQESEFRNSSYFNFNILEWTFDYIVRILQILNRKIERCIKVREGDAVKPDDLLNEIKQNKKEAHNWADYSENKANESQESANLAKDWAIKTESKVQDIDYSAKYYALEASGYARQVQAYSTLKYNVFCVNTGLVENGTPAFLKLEDNILKTVSNFDITNSKGKTFTQTEELSYDISKLQNGVYNIFINPESKNINVISNTIYAQTFLPETALDGDYFLNISKVPYELFEKTHDNMKLLENDVFAAVLIIKGNKKILNINPYNKNIVDLKIEDEIYKRNNSYKFFDLIQKDHKLTFEEKEGLELLGEYVYKEAQEGRYGYPDFYNKCLEEYQEEDNTEEVIGYENMTFQGNLTIENDWASNFSNDNFIEIPAPSEEIQSFRIECEFTLPQEISGNQAVYGQKITNITSPQLIYNSNGSLNFNVPEPNEERAGKWPGKTINIPYTLGATYKTIYEYKDGQVKASVKEASGEWQEYGPIDLTEVFWSEPLCFGKDQDNVIFNGKLNLSSIKIEVNDKFYAGAVKAKVNKNGHKFFNIADKAKVDKIYQDTGVAWYYGVDEITKRIFLPRNDFYAATLTEIPVIGNGITLGFTSGKNPGKSYGLLTQIASTYNSISLCEGAYGQTVESNKNDSRLPSNGSNIGLTLDPENSGMVAPLNIAKKENDFYIYIVVGNVSIKKYNTEITEVTTSENDTLPLFTGMYFDFKPNHISWLKAGTKLSGQIYPSAYNDLLKILKGEETKYGEGLKVIKEQEKLPDIDYSEYWIVDEDTQTFRTPLKTSFLNTISNARILIDKKEPTDDDPSWYNLYSDGWLEQGGLTEAVTDAKIVFPKAFKDKNYFFVIDQTGNDVNSDNSSDQTRYDLRTTKSISVYKYLATESSWTAKGYTTISAEQIAKNENTCLYFKVGNAVQNQQIIDCGEVLEELNNKVSKIDCKAYIINSYVNDTSGYRVWSDGYCEQWGHTNSTAGTTIVLLKAYRSRSYNIFVMPFVNATAVSVSIKPEQTENSFTFVCGSTSTNGYYWKTSGFLSERSV